MLSTLVCIALIVVMAYFAFACLYEVFLWVNTRVTEYRQNRRAKHQQRHSFNPV
jgi:uncharacterized membrane protein YciS (DUF1049 family)